MQVGAGGMGRAWLATIAANPDVLLVGLVDLSTETASAAAAEHGFASVPIGRSVADLLAAGVEVDAVVNVTVPRAHHPVNTAAARRRAAGAVREAAGRVGGGVPVHGRRRGARPGSC